MNFWIMSCMLRGATPAVSYNMNIKNVHIVHLTYFWRNSWIDISDNIGSVDDFFECSNFKSSHNFIQCYGAWVEILDRVSAPRAQYNSVTFTWPNHVNLWLNNLKNRTKYGKHRLLGWYAVYEFDNQNQCLKNPWLLSLLNKFHDYSRPGNKNHFPWLFQATDALPGGDEGDSNLHLFVLFSHLLAIFGDLSPNFWPKIFTFAT